MFELIYAKSVMKDVKSIPSKQLKQIKQGIEALIHFPDIPHIKHLSNHPVAEYRLRIGQYRVLFDVDWEKAENPYFENRSSQPHLLKTPYK